MDPMLLGIAGGSFLVVGAAGYGVYTLLTPSRTARDRLSDFTGGPRKSDEPDPVAAAVAERLATLAQPQSDEDRNVLKRQLIQAGYKSRNAAQVFNATRVALALGLPLLTLPFAATASLMNLAGGVIVCAALGYYLPQLIVNSRIEARQEAIMKPFPDAMDLLVTCVESGLGLDAAMARVAKEMESSAPELSIEFQLVGHEVNAGVPRIEALRHLEERVGVEELKSLVNMLAQAERFGTSVARSLRVHSSITRQKRMAKAEEEAAKVSPKMTVVMMIFLMPTLMIVLLGPAIIRVLNLFS